MSERGSPEDGTRARMHNTTIDGSTYFSMSRKIVMGADLNGAGRLFGGRLMEWVDENAALFCMAQMGTRQIVTKKISEVIFNQPADLGDVLEFLCRVKDAGRTSLTAECLVMTKRIAPADKQKLIVACDLVFVALGPDGRPAPHGYNAATAREPGFEF
jgi:acyl-CoA hydrolase